VGKFIGTRLLRPGVLGRVVFTLLICVSGGWASAQNDGMARPVRVDIGRQPLAAALIEFSKQTGIQVITAAPAVQNLMSTPVKGELPTAVALRRLLEGTQLDFHVLGPNTVGIGTTDTRRTTYRGVFAPSSSAEAPENGLPSATAAEPPPSANPTREGLQEIVVTAQRRAQSAFDVPVSITAYDQATLDVIGARTAEDITRTMPGIIIRPGFEGINTISIRGISSSVGAGTTGIYIDDTPIQVRALGIGGVASSAFPTIFDLDRVEVLRGPQGTLFGSGSEGGTIRFITPTPSLTGSSVYARSELGFTEHGDPSYELGAAGGMPIIENTLGFRASLYGRSDGGWVDRAPYPDDVISATNVNTQTTVVSNVALTWEPFVGLTFTPAVYFQRLHSQDVGQWWPQLSNPSNQQLISGQILAQPLTDQLTLPSLRVQWDLGQATLFSNTSYLNHIRDVVGDYSFINTEGLTGNYTGPHVPSPDPFENPQQAFTQEFRLQSNDSGQWLSWLAGVFYQQEKQKAIQVDYSPEFNDVTLALFGATVQQVFGVGLYQGNIAYEGLDTSKDTQIALFGDVGIHFSRAWTLDLGARIAHTKFTFTNAQFGPFNGGNSGATGGESESPISPKVTLNYKPDSDLLLYASAAKGFRPGGANTPVPAAQCASDLHALGLTAAPNTYDSDTTWSYEVGSKLKALNGRVLLEGSLFYVDWKNIQSYVPLSQCGFEYVGNLGQAVSKGFDLQTSLEIVSGLIARVALGYTDAEYSEAFDTAPGIPLVSVGDKLDTPPWHISAAADYNFGPEHRAYAHLEYDSDSAYDLQHPADVTYDARANHEFSTRLMSARLGFRPGNWDASLFVNNLLNSHDITSFYHDFVSSDLIRYTSLRPRMIGVTVMFRY
jgi:iron complex outermembrane receptor protein